MFEPYKAEGLYIAGPECFYHRGYDLWWSQRKLAEYYGIPVVLPTSTDLKLDHEDLRENAEEIFKDLIEQVKHTTAIIADLEFFRGSEPDGGTVFELGWIWARQGRLYGYSRDLRPMHTKNQAARIQNGEVVDQKGWPHPYGDLPFCPSIVASTKLIEGSFSDALRAYMLDLDEARKNQARAVESPKRLHITAEIKTSKPVAYLAGPERYSPDADIFYAEAKQLCSRYGYHAVTPLDDIKEFNKIDTNDPFVSAVADFEKAMALIRASDLVIANLEDFHGMEPNNDTAFECGAAYGMGKRCIGYMPDTSIMQKRIPHIEKDGTCLDWCGFVVENFNYPINLMFACSMPMYEGSLESALLQSKEN